MNSILTSIKKLLGITEECEDFDVDIIMHINSVFMVLQQLGVGPPNGFSIADKSTEWSEYLIQPEFLEAVKTYIYLKVRLVFDPPQVSAVLTSIQEMIKELEWRLNVQVESFKVENQNGSFISKSKVSDFVYELTYDGLDYDFAKNYFRRAYQVPVGMCTSFRSGSFYGRSLDWFYNNQAEFVIRNKRAAYGDNLTYSSIGMAGGFKELTTEFVSSGQESDLYKVVPFVMTDGINEKGLVASYHVVPTDYGKNTTIKAAVETREELDAFMLIRYVLDNCALAQEAAEYIRDYVDVKFSKFLQDMNYELHFMFADPWTTFSLEFIDGEAIVKEIKDKPFMTNFYLEGVEFNEDGTVYTPTTQTEEFNAFDTNHVTMHGSGLERYNICAEKVITSEDDMLKALIELKYSMTYVKGEWLTEFVDSDLTVKSNPEDFEEILSKAKEAWEKRDRNNPKVWHSTHQCLYDMSKKSITAQLQEENLYYVFE